MMWKASVVLPLDSGPKISTTLPRGTPPTPSATSSPSEPVDMAGTRTATASSPMRMMAPFPNCRSIWATALSRALSFSTAPPTSSSRYRGLQCPLFHDRIQSALTTELAAIETHRLYRERRPSALRL